MIARNAPATALDEPALIHRIISNNASFAELWRSTRSPRFVLLCVAKIFRLPAHGAPSTMPVVSLAPFVANADFFPPLAIAHLQKMQRGLGVTGFTAAPIQTFQIDDEANHVCYYVALVLGDDRRAIARLTVRAAAGKTLQQAQRIVEIITRLDDGQIFCSTNSPCHQDAPPGVVLHARFPAKAEQLAAQHVEALRALPMTVLPIDDEAQARALAEEFQAALFEDGARRGLYRAAR